MSLSEVILRQLEDFILAERDLLGAGTIRFMHQGAEVRGYPYIRSSNEHFEGAIQTAMEVLDRPVESIRFLEVGSGIGTKTELARLLGMQAAGLDYKKEYVELASEIFPHCTFHQANALKFDYSCFDLVYYHQPLASVELMYELELQCLTQLPVTSILVATQITPALEPQLEIIELLCDTPSIVEVELHVDRLRGLQKRAPFSVTDLRTE